MLTRFIHVMLFSIVPWVELRLAIPYGITKGLPPAAAFSAAVLASWAVIIPVFLGMDLFYERFLSRYAVVRRLIQEVRRHGRKYVERWGVVGVGIYVSLPLPGPGVYSGAVLAWTFELPRRQAILALAVGVLVSAFLVTLISTGLIAVIRRFV
ncbi:MAG TPA: small multi-drug export protein [bacterium]|nr:small multi-drug export protein [bacterium]